MKLEMSFAEILQSQFSGVAGKQGHKDLNELYDHVVELGGDLNTVDDFVDVYFAGDGDAFIEAVLHAWSETLDQLDEYMNANESRQIRRSRESRIRRRSRLNYRRWSRKKSRMKSNIHATFFVSWCCLRAYQK